MSRCRHGHAAPRILVVEDEGLIATVVETLEEEGYEVRAAANGHAALALIRTLAPCLILLDILMPAMDGRAVLRELGRLETAADIPVVLVIRRRWADAQ
jgi:CheY-like chemotaxis protein